MPLSSFSPSTSTTRVARIRRRSPRGDRRRRGGRKGGGRRPRARDSQMWRGWAQRPKRRTVGRLVGEQPALLLDSAGVPAQVPPGGDHPVAREQDGDGVLAVGVSDGAGAAGADAAGQFTVSHDLAPGDGPECLPDDELVLGAVQVEGRELRRMAGEVVGQRLEPGLQVVPGLLADGGAHAVAAAEGDAADACVGGLHREGADRRPEAGEGGHGDGSLEHRGDHGDLVERRRMATVFARFPFASDVRARRQGQMRY